jgi:hypothetical protein
LKKASGNHEGKETSPKKKVLSMHDSILFIALDGAKMNQAEQHFFSVLSLSITNEEASLEGVETIMNQALFKLAR